MRDFTQKPQPPKVGLNTLLVWNLLKEKPPSEEWIDLLVCLKNGAILKANYSNIRDRKMWYVIGFGELTKENPVKYWAYLPEPPH